MTDPKVREVYVQLRPGDTDSLRRYPAVQRLLRHPVEPLSGEAVALIGVRVDDGRYAGFAELEPDTGLIGGWLAPHARNGREVDACWLRHTAPGTISRCRAAGRQDRRNP